MGLGGLFFILSALVAPILELVRTAQGRSSRAAWLAVGRQFAIALTMIVAVDLTIRAVYVVANAAGANETPSIEIVTVLPLVPIGITAGILALVLGGAKGMQLASGPRTLDLTLTPPLSRPRVLGAMAAITAAWFTLLAIGASELAPVPGRDRGPGDTPGTAEPRDGPPDVAAPGGPPVDAAPATSPSDAGRRADADSVGLGANGGPDQGEGSGPGDGGPSGSGGGGDATGGPPDAPATPPNDSGSPPPASPPDDPGPPENAGPSPDSSAPDHAGPPPHAGQGGRSGSGGGGRR